MNKIQTLKGFRDFYPEDKAFQNWFYGKIKSVSESFGFEEYEGPIVEPLDLYAAKSGEELVKKQAFTLEDKSGNALALRPEMTPTLAKMIAQKEGSLVFPVKWFTYGPRFRYEQPQKGRGRQFNQWDIDILGVDSYLADAEIIAVAATMFKALGLTPDEVKIKINDRQYLQDEIIALGIGKDKTKDIFKIIDKKSKVDGTTFDAMLKDTGLSNILINKINGILNDKMGYTGSTWLSSIFEIIKSFGVSEYIEFDSSIVRGLDYYTRTVFEGWDTKGNFRAIWGGGRYDNLTQNVGGKQKISGVGFAMGDMVMEELLKANNKYPKLTPNQAKVLVTIFSSDLLDSSINLVNKLRQNNVNSLLYVDSEAKLDKQLKYTDKKGIPYVAIIGPEEKEKDVVTLKNLQTKEQKTLPLDEVISLLK